ncbi:uncharacterized protein C8orf58 homolog [Sceloporus undulatus]|uniref:uncharacterized protein C8orf58 homolog n=1 Tax=Sceloporus undulatus TaxID=8520 RepID=UPI001C4DAC9D|nr:uncharacterized protein C8orf58 homolog [Sceloporus undulatus]
MHGQIFGVFNLRIPTFWGCKEESMPRLQSYRLLTHLGHPEAAGESSFAQKMLRRRRVFSVEPTWDQASAWRSGESCVVLTSVSMYRKLQDPQTEMSLRLELDGGMTHKVDRWAEAGSPTEDEPHQLSFLPSSGRLLKSESEDSGVEMASNDHSPSTPVGSEKSFSLDCLDGFQPSTEDSSLPAAHQSFPEEKGQDVPDPVQDRTYQRSLSISKKLAQVVQRSQKHRLPSHSPQPPSQRPRSLMDLEELKCYHLSRMESVDGIMDMANGIDDRPLFGSSTPEEHSTEKQVLDDPSLAMPGQGLRYLEHICQMLEKIAHLQRANLRLQHQQKMMECQIRAQKLENEGFSEETSEGSGMARVGPQPENPAASEMEEETEREVDSPAAWHPHHFRARSASDTRELRSPARNLGNRPDCPRKSAAHFASSPSLLDQLDGGSRTLPVGIKIKNEHSHWSKVRVLINRMKRKSVRTNEPSSPCKPASSSSRRQCGADIAFDRQESQHKRHFLPSLGAKKRHSKHLSIR